MFTRSSPPMAVAPDFGNGSAGCGAVPARRPRPAPSEAEPVGIGQGLPVSSLGTLQVDGENAGAGDASELAADLAC